MGELALFLLLGNLFWLTLWASSRARLEEARRQRDDAQQHARRLERELSCVTGGVSDEMCWRVARRLGILLSHRDETIARLVGEKARLERQLEHQECAGR